MYGRRLMTESETPVKTRITWTSVPAADERDRISSSLVSTTHKVGELRKTATGRW